MSTCQRHTGARPARPPFPPRGHDPVADGGSTSREQLLCGLWLRTASRRPTASTPWGGVAGLTGCALGDRPAHSRFGYAVQPARGGRKKKLLREVAWACHFASGSLGPPPRPTACDHHTGVAQPPPTRRHPNLPGRSFRASRPSSLPRTRSCCSSTRSSCTSSRCLSAPGATQATRRQSS